MNETVGSIGSPKLGVRDGRRLRSGYISQTALQLQNHAQRIIPWTRSHGTAQLGRSGPSAVCQALTSDSSSLRAIVGTADCRIEDQRRPGLIPNGFLALAAAGVLLN